jgi:peptidoglycan/xylan/chitin deacetylase (PgdA/CDA1 family)
MATQSNQGAHYLLRFDDMCPTMDWSLWDEVEGLLLEAGVKPILAVIPDNRDPMLMVDPPSPVFWDRVRTWQARGWSIGLHGYQHTYVNAEPGILRLNQRSEFAGLSYEEQFEKLRKGLEVFEREGVHADAWVAPAHSFDWVTVSALAALGIRTISDGMALAPYRDPQGNVWIPQQFANMRAMPLGVWTYCYHLVDLTPEAMVLFRMRLKQLSPRMISLQDAAQMGIGPRSTGDRLVGALRQAVSGIRRFSR